LLRKNFKNCSWNWNIFDEIRWHFKLWKLKRSFFLSSCTFHSVGTAAGEQKFNSLCVLSLNIINEKIYIFLWFWFGFVTLATAIHITYRVMIIMMPYSRFVNFELNKSVSNQFLNLFPQASFFPKLYWMGVRVVNINLVHSNDWSGSNIFYPGQVGSIFCCSVRFGSTIFGLGLSLENFS